MKKLFFPLMLAAGMLFFSGCAGSYTEGFFYTGNSVPSVDLEVESESDAGMNKVGTADCTNILGIIATGDCSVAAAMQNGDIEKVHHVDYEKQNILGLYMKLTTKVYGE